MITEKGAFVPCRNCNTHLPKRNYLRYVRLCIQCRKYGCTTCFLDGICKDCTIANTRTKEVSTYFREKSSMLPSILGAFFLFLLLPFAQAEQFLSLPEGLLFTGVNGSGFLAQSFLAPLNIQVSNLNVSIPMAKDTAGANGNVWIELWNTSTDTSAPETFLLRSNMTLDARDFTEYPTTLNLSFTFGNSVKINTFAGYKQYVIVIKHTSNTSLPDDELYVKRQGVGGYTNGTGFISGEAWSSALNTDFPMTITGDITMPTPDITPPVIYPPANQSSFYNPAFLLTATIQDDFPFNATWECFNQTQNYNLTQTSQDINFTLSFNLTQSCVITAYDQSNNTDSKTFTLTLIPPVPEPPVDYLEANNCPDDSIQSVLMFGLILVLIIAFIVIAKVYIKVPMVSMIACLFLMFPAGVLLGCSRILGVGVAIFSLLLMIESMFNG